MVLLIDLSFTGDFIFLMKRSSPHGDACTEQMRTCGEGSCARVFVDTVGLL